MNFNSRLGSGCCSIVYKGLIRGEAPVLRASPTTTASTQQAFTNCEVAVKMLPPHANDMQKSDFLKEIVFMKVRARVCMKRAHEAFFCDLANMRRSSATTATL